MTWSRNDEAPGLDRRLGHGLRGGAGDQNRTGWLGSLTCGSYIVQPGEREGPARILRIALAMRGGVSLAVWIGGAVAEIDLLRRAGVQLLHAGGQVPPVDPADDPRTWPRRHAYMSMLHTAGYTGVEIDVLAGASAGGLNGVIYGYAQSLGIGVDWLLDVWKDNGHIWTLMRQTRSRWRIQSLLRGDERSECPPRRRRVGASPTEPSVLLISSGCCRRPECRRRPTRQPEKAQRVGYAPPTRSEASPVHDQPLSMQTEVKNPG